MNSFIFPEDLDLGPSVRTAHSEPRHKPQTASKVQDRLPMPSIKRRPVPIFVPPDVDFSSYLNAAAAATTKPKDDVVVSVTRLSLDERSPRLQKPQRSPGHARWNSATLSKSGREERDTRLGPVEAGKMAQRRPSQRQQQHRDRSAQREQRPHRKQLAPLAEHERDGRRSPADYGVAHVVF